MKKITGLKSTISEIKKELKENGYTTKEISDGHYSLNGWVAFSEIENEIYYTTNPNVTNPTLPVDVATVKQLKEAVKKYFEKYQK